MERSEHKLFGRTYPPFLLSQESWGGLITHPPQADS